MGVNGQGMIENLCLKSVSDQPGFPCVDSYFACIAQKSTRSAFSAKAKVRVWMASHVDFEYHVGKAAVEGLAQIQIARGGLFDLNRLPFNASLD